MADRLESARSDAMLALAFAEGPQKVGDVKRLLVEEPLYHYEPQTVDDVLSELKVRNWLSESDNRLQTAVPSKEVEWLIPTPDSAAKAVGCLTAGELAFLEGVLSHGGCAEKEDMVYFGADIKEESDDPWRIADASRSVGTRRLVIETLNSKGRVVFVIPPAFQAEVRTAHSKLLEGGLLDKRRKAFLERLDEIGALSDPRVKAAFTAVPREEFFPSHLRHLAYTGAQVEIERPVDKWRAHDGLSGWGISAPKRQEYLETISRLETADPVDVAELLSLLEAGIGQRVLICGVQEGLILALVATMVGEEGEVVGIDDNVMRIQAAHQHIRRLRLHCVRLQQGDPTAGIVGSQFHRILVLGNVPRVPSPLQRQLRDDGLMLVPIEQGEDRTLLLIKNKLREARDTKDGNANNDLKCRDSFCTIQYVRGFSFPPLKGAFGWGDDAEMLTDLDTLRVCTAAILRNRFKINRAWQQLKGRDLLSCAAESEKDIALLLELAEDEDELQQFILALVKLTIDAVTEDFLRSEKGNDPERYRKALELREIIGITDAEFGCLNNRFKLLRYLRNYPAHHQSEKEKERMKPIFEQFCGKSFPVDKLDYRRLQRTMLTQIAAALDDWSLVFERIIRQKEGRE